MADERANELDGANGGMTEETQEAAVHAAEAAEGGNAAGASEDENWRMNRDAAALARQKLQAADGAGQAEEPDSSLQNPPVQEAENAPQEAEKSLSHRERRQKEKEEKERRRREEQEAKEREKREAQEAKERRRREEQEAKEREKREAQEEKERGRRLAEEERQRKLHEKKEARAVVKQERRQEWKSLWHMAEFAMLVTFIVLAVDQAGLYGFLFVWLFVAVMIASIALLLLGIVRAVRKKRCGIIFFVAVVGIIACTAWFIFLVSSQGLGLGPVPE